MQLDFIPRSRGKIANFDISDREMTNTFDQLCKGI